MSRKTKLARSRSPRRRSSIRHFNVHEVPRVGRRVSLICGACGASGEYDVGSVTIDPTLADPVARDAVERTVGFTGYFRCRECDAGGPWELPPETVLLVTALGIAALSGMEDVPVVFGSIATFDNKAFRYATDCEAHLKNLIEAEPERAFLWVRLGNLYSHADEKERAEEAYERAIELDPEDIEAHGMLGQLLACTNRPMESVPHFHAVLRHVREAHQVPKKLRRELLRGAIESLLEAHAASSGQIDLLPTMDSATMERASADEPLVVELREFDLGSERGMNDLCDTFLQAPRQAMPDFLRRRGKPVLESPNDWAAAPIRREERPVGRNARCPCGSGRKYKKCCGK